MQTKLRVPKEETLPGMPLPEVKDRPILMRPEMARATLDDLKTQTRRVVKPQPLPGIGESKPFRMAPDKCPYGKPGDRLWVKETHWRCGRWAVHGVTKKGKPAWRFEASNSYTTAFEDLNKAPLKNRSQQGWHKRPSIFLRRKDSRITLEIVAVRVERLQDISEADAVAEGVRRVTKDNQLFKFCVYDSGADMSSTPWAIMRSTAVGAYAELWESINGKGSWEKNPWVWVITFKRIKP